MASLKNKTILLTGASSGIGEALAYELAKKGATLILSGRNADKLQTVKQACKHSKRHAIVAFDITDSKPTPKPKPTQDALIGSSTMPAFRNAH